MEVLNRDELGLLYVEVKEAADTVHIGIKHEIDAAALLLISHQSARDLGLHDYWLSLEDLPIVLHKTDVYCLRPVKYGLSVLEEGPNFDRVEGTGAEWDDR